MRRFAVVAPLLLLAACGSSSSGGGASNDATGAGGMAVIDCLTGSHRVGTACVPDNATGGSGGSGGGGVTVQPTRFGSGKLCGLTDDDNVVFSSGGMVMAAPLGAPSSATAVAAGDDCSAKGRAVLVGVNGPSTNWTLWTLAHGPVQVPAHAILLGTTASGDRALLLAPAGGAQTNSNVDVLLVDTASGASVPILSDRSLEDDHGLNILWHWFVGETVVVTVGYSSYAATGLDKIVPVGPDFGARILDVDPVSSIAVFEEAHGGLSSVHLDGTQVLPVALPGGVGVHTAKLVPGGAHAVVEWYSSGFVQVGTVPIPGGGSPVLLTEPASDEFFTNLSHDGVHAVIANDLAFLADVGGVTPPLTLAAPVGSGTLQFQTAGAFTRDDAFVAGNSVTQASLRKRFVARVSDGSDAAPSLPDYKFDGWFGPGSIIIFSTGKSFVFFHPADQTTVEAPASFTLSFLTNDGATIVGDDGSGIEVIAVQ